MKSIIAALALTFMLAAPVTAQDSLSGDAYTFNLHCGIDLFAKGLHIGGMVYVQEHFSVEGSYGWAVQNILDNWSYHASVGLNWHKRGASSLIAGIAYSKSYFVSLTEVEQEFYSAAIGSYIIDEGGLKFYYRGGIVLEVKENYSGRHIQVWPNIDFGVSINIF